MSRIFSESLRRKAARADNLDASWILADKDRTRLAVVPVSHMRQHGFSTDPSLT